jgi:cysteine desulfurase/selenocysteine lyase
MAKTSTKVMFCVYSVVLLFLGLIFELRAQNYRSDFPIFQLPENKNLIFFDNGATSQKPYLVIDKIMEMYAQCCANIHRGDYRLSRKATEEYEHAREKMAKFINADPESVIFTKGATEGLNFLATTWGEKELKPGDEILLTEMEHNSNLLPWLNVAKKKNAVVKFIKLGADGYLKLNELPKLLTSKTKLVSITRTSNALGTNNPVAEIITAAHAVGALVCIDGCQSVPYEQTDIKSLDADFFVFSGHKMLGPTGIGVLYIKKIHLDSMQPYQWGGGMVDLVKDPSNIILNAPPDRFEAGTPPIAEAVALGAAVDYLSGIDKVQLKKQLANLCKKMINGLEQIPHVTIYGPKDQLKQEGHLVVFNVDKIIAWRIAEYLDKKANIAVRSSKHCAHLVAKVLGYHSSVRASFYLYNTEAEVDKFLETLRNYMNNQYEKDLKDSRYSVLVEKFDAAHKPPRWDAKLHYD